MLLTRSPLSTYRSRLPVRLACVRHAASVHPEPGSNSPYSWGSHLFLFNSLSELTILLLNCTLVSKIYLAKSLSRLRNS